MASLPAVARKTETTAVVPVPDLSPLEMEREGDHLRFGLKPQDDIIPELPSEFEQVLERRLAEILGSATQLTVEINLANAPAISSRQLGSLIALQKVLRRRFERIPVTGVSASVRHLLSLTRTDQLFDM